MWSNIVVAASNLYALRVISHLYVMDRHLPLLIFCGSMTSSILFHLVETDEIVSTSPVNRTALPGIIGAEKAYYGHTFLFLDRLFAIAAVVISMVFLCEQRNGGKRALLVPNWTAVLSHSGAALVVTAISEFSVFEVFYVITHCLWHLIVFHMAFWIFHPVIQSPFYQRTRTR